MAGSVLQLPQAARLSLGLVQARVLPGRGGVWQILAWRRAAVGPLRGGVGQVGIHQLHDLFYLGALQEELALSYPQCQGMGAH